MYRIVAAPFLVILFLLPSTQFAAANSSTLGSIGNQVWIEQDIDGVFGTASTDVGVAGVTVELSQNGDFIAKATTGADGRYTFENLQPGIYALTVTDEENILIGYEPTRYHASSADNTNKFQSYEVVLEAGENDVTGDFGYFMPTQPTSIALQSAQTSESATPLLWGAAFLLILSLITGFIQRRYTR